MNVDLSMKLNLSGFRIEPDSPLHKIYEDVLKFRMKPIWDGDVDLRKFSSPRHDNSTTNSCVANAVVKALEIKRIQKYGHASHVDLSRLAVYYLARELMSPPETNKDNGTYVSHALDAIRRFGVCEEKDWPFDVKNVNVPPSWLAMRKAYKHKISSFYKIRSVGTLRIDAVIECLRAGNPVIFGTKIGDNWVHYKKDQVLDIPKKYDGQHATVLLGYKDGKFIGENSWGALWGDNGFYYMDPDVIGSSVSEQFWVPQAGWEQLL